MTTLLAPGTYVRHTTRGHAIVVTPWFFKRLRQRGGFVHLVPVHGAEVFKAGIVDCVALSDWDIKMIKARVRDRLIADRRASRVGWTILAALLLPVLGLSAFANSRAGQAAYASFEAWRTAPPACDYRLVPQRDGTFLAYRC